jgi:integrase
MHKSTALAPKAEHTTLKQALERLLREVTSNKKGRISEARRVKTWMKHPLAQRFLSDLRSAEFETYRDEQLSQGKAWNKVRLELVLISVLYKVAARRWGMQDLDNPITRLALSPKRSARHRRLVGDEEQRLLAQLKTLGAYFAPLTELAIESAMRQAELLALTHADLDLEHRIARVRDTTNSRVRIVPLSPRAVEIIRGLPRTMSLLAPLFAVSQDAMTRTFRKACSEAGIQDLKFQDLRHEAISRMCKRLPMQEAMRVIGYKTPAMLKRYYRSPQEELIQRATAVQS